MKQPRGGKLAREKSGLCLDVGCRDRKEPNWIGIDGRVRVGVDIVHDLASFPYPLDSESCLTIKAAHVIEHIPPGLVFLWFDEMWRLLKPDGQLAVSAPYAGSLGFWSDPTHCTGITEGTFQHLDPANPLYMQYEPKPWKIEHLVYRPHQNIEAILRKRTIVSGSCDQLAIKSLLLGAMQKQSEIRSLYELLQPRTLKTVVEIGTAAGGVFFGLCQLAKEDATIVSIDLPGGAFGGGYTEAEERRFLAFARNGQRLHFLKLDSHEPETLKKLKGILDRKHVDLLFIDGDHTYDGVKKDFEMYSPLVKKGGLIVFHDILTHPHVPECQVDRFWKEVKRGRKTVEYIDETDQTWGGIGVVMT